MKTIKSFLAFTLVAFMGTSAVADGIIELVGTESKQVTSTAKVTANYYWRYYLQSASGMSTNYSDYVTNNSTSPQKNGSSAVTKAATFTGKKFTPGYVKAWLQQRQGTSGGFASLEAFTVYVAQANAISATVGGGNKTIATPTILSAANWACKSANTGVATATVNTGSATTRTVTITPVAAGTTTIDVRSGSSTYSTSNPLRQRITVTVSAPTPTTTTNMVDVVEGETIALVTSTNVLNNQSCTFSIDSGSTSYVNIGQSQGGTFGTADITKTAASTAQQTIYVKGIKFTGDQAIVKTQGYRYDSTASHMHVDVFIIHVAKPEKAPVTVSGSARAISTPTIKNAAFWALNVADPRIATATVGMESTTQSTVTIMPKAEGTTTIDVRSGSSTYSTSNPLRQSIILTVTGDGSESIVVSNIVFVSNHEAKVLVKDDGQKIAWSAYRDHVSSDENIATVVQMGEYVAVSNTVNNGEVQVKVMTPGTNYIFSVLALTAEIEKTVKEDPANPSNATVRITTHIAGIPPPQTNNILFLSSMCIEHGYTTEIAKKAIDTLATKGEVHWFMYGLHRADIAARFYGYEHEREVIKNGTVKLGETVSASACALMDDPNKVSCNNLMNYLTELNRELDDNHSKYDYVVLSFDGNLLGCYYDPDPWGGKATDNNDDTLNAGVARKLRWYYENNRVIWLHAPINRATGVNPPFSDNDIYRPNTAMEPANWNEYACLNGWLLQLDGNKGWEAMVAILDPVTYLDRPGGHCYTDTTTFRHPQSTKSNRIYAANANPLQVPYDNAAEVAKTLEQHVQAAIVDAKIDDKIVNLNQSLTVQANRFYGWKGPSNPTNLILEDQVIADLPNDDNGAPRPTNYWQRLSSDPSGNYSVSTNIFNVTGEQWYKYEIDIHDDGHFLEECLKQVPPRAELDPKTGKYRVNPNDGPARLTLITEVNGVKTPVVVEDGTLMDRWQWTQFVQDYIPWITDHADAGTGKVHLAFQPLVSGAPILSSNLCAWINIACSNDLIRYVRADTEANLSNSNIAHPRNDFTLRDGTGTQDVEKGWCWITIPDITPVSNRYVKIVLQPLTTNRLEIVQGIPENGEK